MYLYLPYTVHTQNHNTVRRAPVCLRNENAVNPFGTGFKKNKNKNTRKNSVENHAAAGPFVVVVARAAGTRVSNRAIVPPR